MPDSGKPDTLRLGFLTSLALAERAFVGGLLVTNHLGRPLEFQCTAPVRPNRTQEILYGPTLTPFLLGEVIGRTLVEKATVKPVLVLVDDSALLDLRRHIDIPVACLERAAGDGEGVLPDWLAAAPRLQLGSQTAMFHPDFAADRATLAERAELVPKEADIREPFSRVRDALQETLAANGAAAA